MKKLFTSIFLFVFMLFLVPVTSNAASANDPYCRISYDSNVGCNTVKYYYYVQNVARYDATRLVKFYDGKILLGTSNTVVTTNHKAGTNPAWTTDGSYLVWIDDEGNLMCRAYKGSSNSRLITNAQSINLNAESMIETVGFFDGSSTSIKKLIKGTKPETKPSTPETQKPQAPKPENQKPEAPKPSPSTKVLKEWTDTQGREHFEFSTNKLIVDGADVYFNDFKISEVCNSGVRFIGIDTSYRVYLYEDATDSYYRFSPSNIFVPKKISFPKKAKLKSVITNSSGFMTGVVTTKGTFKLSELKKQKKWTPPISYAINKDGYTTYYKKGSTKSYTLTLKGKSLYLGKSLAATGIKTKTASFGFANNKIYYVKNGTIYCKAITNLKKATAVSKGTKLTYSSDNGLVKLK